MRLDVVQRLWQYARLGLFLIAIFCVAAGMPAPSIAAPYAAMVIDARTGEVLHSRNADTRLHPASLTKMMTLYVTFEAVRKGEISMDTVVTISKNAAAEPPSKLGLRAGQKIKLRYLVRAAAVKSANDAATAIGEAVSGSEAAFARRMNRTAKALGMTRTSFKNAHGLTETGHMSTARDMTTMGRRILYDYPQYYNLFSRRSTHAGIKEVNNTNRRFLDQYRGADGIKTGYTRAAGFNLVSSAERGNERVIATVFGGRSTATRNAKIMELLDLGFRRAPSNAKTRKPALPAYTGNEEIIVASKTPAPGTAGKTVRVSGLIKKSLRPQSRAVTEAKPELLLAMQNEIQSAVLEAQETVVAQAAVAPSQPAAAMAAIPQLKPADRPNDLVLASTAVLSPKPAAAPLEQEVVTRISTSGGKHWGINVGRYPSRYKAERVLLKTALNEMTTLDGSLRKIVKKSGGFDANFMGLSRETADLACRRLQARNVTCFMIGPS